MQRQLPSSTSSNNLKIKNIFDEIINIFLDPYFIWEGDFLYDFISQLNGGHFNTFINHLQFQRKNAAADTDAAIRDKKNKDRLQLQQLITSVWHLRKADLLKLFAEALAARNLSIQIIDQQFCLVEKLDSNEQDLRALLKDLKEERNAAWKKNAAALDSTPNRIPSALLKEGEAALIQSWYPAKAGEKPLEEMTKKEISQANQKFYANAAASLVKLDDKDILRIMKYLQVTNKIGSEYINQIYRNIFSLERKAEDEKVNEVNPIFHAVELNKKEDVISVQETTNKARFAPLKNALKKIGHGLLTVATPLTYGFQKAFKSVENFGDYKNGHHIARFVSLVVGWVVGFVVIGGAAQLLSSIVPVIGNATVGLTISMMSGLLCASASVALAKQISRGISYLLNRNKINPTNPEKYTLTAAAINLVIKKNNRNEKDTKESLTEIYVAMMELKLQKNKFQKENKKELNAQIRKLRETGDLGQAPALKLIEENGKKKVRFTDDHNISYELFKKKQRIIQIQVDSDIRSVMKVGA